MRCRRPRNAYVRRARQGPVSAVVRTARRAVRLARGRSTGRARAWTIRSWPGSLARWPRKASRRCGATSRTWSRQALARPPAGGRRHRGGGVRGRRARERRRASRSGWAASRSGGAWRRRGRRGHARRRARVPRLPAASPGQAGARSRRASVRHRGADAVPAGHEGSVRDGRGAGAGAREARRPRHACRGRRRRALARTSRGKEDPREVAAALAPVVASFMREHGAPDAAQEPPRSRVLPRRPRRRTRHAPTRRSWAQAPGYEVRNVGGQKAYRCPGCDHEVRAGVWHLVVVPDGDVDARRHWHTECWRRELRRQGLYRPPPEGSRRPRATMPVNPPPTDEASSACIVSESKRLPCDQCGHPMEPEHAHYRCPAATTSSLLRLVTACPTRCAPACGRPAGVRRRVLDVPAYIEVTGVSRRECLAELRARSPATTSTLTVEVVPDVVGVAEAAEIMGWDKRRVVTYIDRGSFPEPITVAGIGSHLAARGRAGLRRRMAHAPGMPPRRDRASSRRNLPSDRPPPVPDPPRPARLRLDRPRPTRLAASSTIRRSARSASSRRGCWPTGSNCCRGRPRSTPRRWRAPGRRRTSTPTASAST